MNKVKLIESITNFITQKEFAEIVKKFKINGNDNELKVTVSFDLNKMTSEPIVEESESEEEDPTEDVEQVEEKIEESEENSVTIDEVAPTEDVTIESVVVELPKVITSEVIKKPVAKVELDESIIEATPQKSEIKSVGKDGTKTLYGDHEFTSDETTYIKAYLAGELKKKEAVELLEMTAYDFEKLVNKYKRCKNIKAGVKETTEKRKSYLDNLPTKGSPNALFDYSTIDFDKMYNDVVKHGDSVSAIARDYGCAQSTLNRKFNEYCKVNNLEYNPIHIGSRASKKEEVKKDSKSITKQTKTEETDVVKESIAAKKKWEAMIGEKVNCPNGWRKMDDGIMHLVKDGVIVR